jgi:hypothetical protein
MKNLIELVKGVKGCQFANLTYVTDGGIPQKVLGKGTIVTKLVRTDCQVNYSYQNAVNNRLAKQGNEQSFVAESLPWGEWETPNKLISHKGTMYLRYYDVANADIQSVWFVNGRLATAEEFLKIMEYLQSKKKGSSRQAEAGLTENQVKPKVVKLESILRLAVNGCEWFKVNEFEKAIIQR